MAGRRPQLCHAAAFFAALGDRKHSIRAISIDTARRSACPWPRAGAWPRNRHGDRRPVGHLSGAYAKAIREQLPDARIAGDPFHVVRVAADAVDQVRRDARNAHERSHTATGRWVKHTRWALLKAPERQSLGSLGTLGEVYLHNRRLYRAFLLFHELRLLYQLADPALAPAHLDAWLQCAARSRPPTALISHSQ